MYTLLRWWGRLPNDDWAGYIALLPLLLLFFPWAVARVRGIGKLNPLKRRLSVWAALPMALLVFMALGFFGTLLAWSNAGAIAEFCPPGMSEPRGQAFLVLMVNIPVSLLTGMAYRAMCWERGDVPRGGECGQATTAAGSGQSPSEDTGQTSTGRGAETGPVKN
jgi:hypothetical protein